MRGSAVRTVTLFYLVTESLPFETIALSGAYVENWLPHKSFSFFFFNWIHQSVYFMILYKDKDVIAVKI